MTRGAQACRHRWREQGRWSVQSVVIEVNGVRTAEIAGASGRVEVCVRCGALRQVAVHAVPGGNAR